MRSPARGRPRIPPVTQTALQLLLACGTWWDGANTLSQCVLQELPLPSGTWDHFKASLALGKLKRISYKLMKQL